MSLQCNLVIAFLIIGLTHAASSSNEIPFEKSSAKLKCDSAYSLTCLKLDILSLIDKIATTNKEFNIGAGVTLVREENPNKTQNIKIVSGKDWGWSRRWTISSDTSFTDLARAFPDSPEKRLNGFLVAKLQDVLQSYSLKLKLTSEDSQGVFEGRKGDKGGKKGGGGLGALIGMAAMMKGESLRLQIHEI